MDQERATPPDIEPGPSSSDALNQLGRGEVFCKTRDSNESDIDGIAVVLQKIYTIDTDGRAYRLHGKVTCRSGTAGGVAARLHVNSVQQDRDNDATVGAGKDITFHPTAPLDLDAGEYTFDLVVGRSGAGTNLITALADGGDGSFGMMQLYLEDVGPQKAGS